MVLLCSRKLQICEESEVMEAVRGNTWIKYGCRLQKDSC